MAESLKKKEEDLQSALLRRKSPAAEASQPSEEPVAGQSASEVEG